MKLSTILGAIWRPKGAARRPVGLLLHGAGGLLIGGLPFYLVEWRTGYAIAFVILALGVGVWKEIFDAKRGGYANFLDIIPWGIGAAISVVIVGLKAGA